MRFANGQRAPAVSRGTAHRRNRPHPQPFPGSPARSRRCSEARTASTRRCPGKGARWRPCLTLVPPGPGRRTVASDGSQIPNGDEVRGTTLHFHPVKTQRMSQDGEGACFAGRPHRAAVRVVLLVGGSISGRRLRDGVIALRGDGRCGGRAPQAVALTAMVIATAMGLAMGSFTGIVIASGTGLAMGWFSPGRPA